MKTIATLNGVILMSQDGEALEAMQANATQYGATASVVTDAEYFALVAAQPKTKEEQNAPIYAQLDELDKKLIRPLSEGETERVAQIVAQKAALRAQLV